MKLFIIVLLAASYAGVPNRLQAQPTPIERTVQVRVRNLSGLASKLSSQGRGLNRAEAVAILQTASEIIQTDDAANPAANPAAEPADVACGIDFEFGGLSDFPNAAELAAPDAAVLVNWMSNSQGEVSSNLVVSALQKLEGGVKVVKSISVCGTINSGVVACAEGGKVIVATWAAQSGGYGEGNDDLKTAGSVWLHELAHVLGLEHRPDPPSRAFIHPSDLCLGSEVANANPCSASNFNNPRPLMCYEMALNYRVCSAECDILLQP